MYFLLFTSTLFSFLSLTTLPAWASPSSPQIQTQKSPALKTRVGFKGNHVDDQKVKARVFGLFAHLSLDKELPHHGLFSLGVGANLEAGSSTSLIIDEYAPRRQWTLHHGFIAWKPVSFFDIKGGTLNQGEYKAPLLLGENAFIGAMTTFSTLPSWNWGRLYLKAQQSIPNNHSLTSRLGKVEEGTPTFLSQSVGYQWDQARSDGQIEVTRFSFHNLGSGIAHKSQYMGNSVNPNDEQNARFLYAFQGHNLSFKGFWEWNSLWGIYLEGQYLYNEKAPHKRNTGYLASLGTQIEQWTPFFKVFRNESDSSPGYYNSKEYGHNNRRGHHVGIRYQDPQSQLSFSTYYGQHKLIKDENLYQSPKTRLFAFYFSQDLNF